jgi:hypothetical protein
MNSSAGENSRITGLAMMTNTVSTRAPITPPHRAEGREAPARLAALYGKLWLSGST